MIRVPVLGSMQAAGKLRNQRTAGEIVVDLQEEQLEHKDSREATGSRDANLLELGMARGATGVAVVELLEEIWSQQQGVAADLFSARCRWGLQGGVPQGHGRPRTGRRRRASESQREEFGGGADSLGAARPFARNCMRGGGGL
jgi:hypothetical protein